MTPTTTVSPQWSMKGYSLIVALTKEKETIKNLIAAGAMFSVALTPFIPPKYAVMFGSILGVVGVGSKLVLNAIDYLSTEVVIDDKAP